MVGAPVWVVVSLMACETLYLLLPRCLYWQHYVATAMMAVAP